jgi:hypothetical protein
MKLKIAHLTNKTKELKIRAFLSPISLNSRLFTDEISLALVQTEPTFIENRNKNKQERDKQTDVANIVSCLEASPVPQTGVLIKLN